VIFLCTLSPLTFCSVSAAEDESTAVTGIYESELLMAQAYEAILDAEELGAEVSSLLVKFNGATKLLSQAQMAFGSRDFDDAVSYSESVIEIGHDLTENAKILRIEAANKQVYYLGLILISSVLGIIIVIGVCVFSYRFFKKRYYDISPE